MQGECRRVGTQVGFLPRAHHGAASVLSGVSFLGQAVLLTHSNFFSQSELVAKTLTE